jgi:CSLREA domain-containing protein
VDDGRFGANPLRAAVLALALMMMPAAHGTTILVNSSADTAATDGACTLREAITAANTNAASGSGAGECAAGQALPTVDEIHFAIAGAADAVHTITPTAALPALTQAVVIDGYTQGDASPNTLAVGSDAELLIEISAAALPKFSELLLLNTDGATIRGLVINQIVGSGVHINGHNGNTITGNFINTDPTGNTFEGNLTSSTPLIASGNSNQIGGTNPADRNVVAPAAFNSPIIGITGVGNVVQGNYIDVSADGTSVLQPAIQVADAGIHLLYNGASSDTLIGGTTPGAGNVIAGTYIGISLRFDEAGADHANVIQGNFIGTDATGSYALGSGGNGIQVVFSNNTTIGGADPGAGNLISGYDTGILTYDDEPGTVIQGNRIGTDSTGTHAIPNNSAGIYIATPGFDVANPQSIIGGTNPGEGNTIAYNCGAGIRFANNASDNRWPILGNSIYANRGLGITLANSTAPLANDDGNLDADTGANNRQNYPVITAAPVASAMVGISGTLDSAANTTFHLEFFSGIGCHASGYGEGRHFLGSHDVITNGNGDASFSSVMFSVPAGHSVFTATATDPDGNTSEFSQCFGTPDLLFQNGFEPGCSGSD